MNFSTLIFFILFCSITNCFSIEAPTITSVEQTSEKEVRLTWTFNDNQNNNYELTRYRIFFTDNNGPTLKEWPSQMEKTDEEVAGTPLSQSKVNSTFQCYIECIENPQCQFAEFRNHDLFSNNCFLKSNLEYYKEVESSDDLDGREFYILKKYNSNEVIIKDLPENNRYVFYVSVYDEISREWSKNSEASEPISIRIEFTLGYKIDSNNKVTISWSQTGKFKEYKISRYNLKMLINKSDEVLDYPIKNEIRKYDVTHSYYNLSSNAVLQNNIENTNDCFNECLNSDICIRYVYFYNEKRCYLVAKFNLLQSVYKAKNTEVEGLTSSANSYEVPLSLNYSSDYELVLEYKTLSGVYGISKAIMFSISPVQNILASAINAEQTELIKLKNQRAVLSCNAVDVEETEDQVEWVKVGSDRDFSSLAKEIKGEKSIKSELTLSDLNRSDSGVYRCSLKSDSSISADIRLNVYDPPAKPVIEKVLIKPNGKTFISWDVSDLGGADHLQKVIVSYSSDSAVVPQKTIEIQWTNNPNELDKNQVNLDETIPIDDLVTLELETDYGRSEKAMHVAAICEDGTDCPGKQAKLAEKIEFQPDPPKSNKTTVILVGLIAAIVLIIICFIVYQTCNKKKETDKKEYVTVPQGV